MIRSDPLVRVSGSDSDSDSDADSGPGLSPAKCIQPDGADVNVAKKAESMHFATATMTASLSISLSVSLTLRYFRCSKQQSKKKTSWVCCKFVDVASVLEYCQQTGKIFQLDGSRERESTNTCNMLNEEII